MYICLTDIYLGRTTTYNVDLHQIREASNQHSLTTVFGVENSFLPRFTSKVNTIQGNVAGYVCQDAGGNRVYSFPKPHLVVRITGNECGTGSLINMEFPRTSTLSNEVILTSNEKNTNMSLMNNITSAQNAPFEAETLASKSELRDTEQNNINELKQLKARTKTMEFDESVHLLREWRLKKLAEFSKTWESSHHMSEPLLVMRRWFRGILREWRDEDKIFSASRPIEDCTPLDKELSIFGNMFARRMEWCTAPYDCVSNQKVVMFMSVARLDAYRRGLDLHINWLLTGAGNAGKSYATSIAGDDMSIPHSVEFLAHETAKANAVSHDQNDRITLYHEFPDHLLGISKGQMKNTGDYLFKSSLDQSVMITKEFHRDETTGQRSNLKHTSECIRVVGGCTNEPPSHFPEALMQRFVIIMVPDHNVKGKRKIDRFLSGRTSSEEMKKRRLQVNHYFRVEQYLVCMAEKMIWMKILPDIDTTVFRSMMSELESYVAPRGINMQLPRNMDRVVKMARSMTILHAIEHVFHTPYSVHYGKEFNINMMADLAPFLIVTEEITFNALQMLESQYYMEEIELDVLRTMARQSNYPYLSDYTGYDNGKPSTVEEPQPKWKLETTPFGESTADCNYLEFKGTIWDLAQHLSVTNSVDETKHSPQNINLMLQDMLKRKIECHRYINYNEHTQTKEPMAILESANRSGDKRVFINRQYLDQVLSGKFKNIFEEALLKTTTTVTRPRKIITSRSVDKKFEVLQTVHLQRHSTRLKYDSNVGERNQKLKFIHEAGLYDYEGQMVERFLDNEYLVFQDDDIEVFTPEGYEENFKNYWESVDIPKSYPEDYVQINDTEMEIVGYKGRRRKRARVEI